MAHSDHGIVKDKRAEEQPRDKQRALIRAQDRSAQDRSEGLALA